MTGLIDIGSNTIRLVVYDKKKRIMNTAMPSEILADTKDGKLTREGIKKLAAIILTFLEKAGDIEIYAFATYAFRSLVNKEEVRDEIFENTGVMIDILSGEEEARYDFYGLLGAISRKEDGIGVDLGGGSAQIFLFKEGELKFCSSYPIGCRKLKNKFIKGKFPDDEEEEILREYIREKISGLSGAHHKKIYMMGGTGKTAIKLYSFLKGRENVDTLEVCDLLDIIRFIRETPENVMKNILRYRYDNIIVGIIIMEEIAKMIGAEKIHIKKCGVRDGYIFKKEEDKKAVE